MIANYHTHTWRCGHAEGTERQYVEQAIEAGIQILGFSDHTPYPFPEDYASFFRMALNQADDYFQTVSDLKREYAGQIDIRIGVEAEYYPKYFDALLHLLRQYPCEYMLMGQHYIDNELDGTYSGRISTEESQLHQYVSQSLEGLSTGKFTYFAHPDLPDWQGDRGIYAREMTRLCRGAKDLGIPLELNFAGMSDGRCYPSERFWQIAGQVGNLAVLGCDAHAPQELNKPDLEQNCRQIAQKYGLQVLDTVTLWPLSEE